MNLLVRSAFHMQVKGLCDVTIVAVKCFVKPVGSSGGVRGQSATPHPATVLLVCRQSWLVVCAVLATSLLASLGGNLIQTCRKCKERTERVGYSYLPLGEINGAAERGRGQRTKPGKNLFQQQDWDSQDSS